MKIIFVIILFFCGITPINNGCLQLDIMMIGDFSGSIEGHEYQIGNALKGFINRFELAPDGIKSGYITFSDRAHLQMPLTDDIDSLIYAIDRTSSQKTDGGATYLSFALEAAIEEYNINQRFGVKKVLLIVSDGLPNDGERTIMISEMLRNEGVIICTVFVRGIYGGNTTFLEKISTPGYYYESDWQNLATTLKKLEICM